MRCVLKGNAAVNFNFSERGIHYGYTVLGCQLCSLCDR